MERENDRKSCWWWHHCRLQPTVEFWTSINCQPVFSDAAGNEILTSSFQNTEDNFKGLYLGNLFTQILRRSILKSIYKCFLSGRLRAFKDQICLPVTRAHQKLACLSRITCFNRFLLTSFDSVSLTVILLLSTFIHTYSVLWQTTYCEDKRVFMAFDCKSNNCCCFSVKNNLCYSVVRKLFPSNKMLVKFGARKSLQKFFILPGKFILNVVHKGSEQSFFFRFL